VGPFAGARVQLRAAPSNGLAIGALLDVRAHRARAMTAQGPFHAPAKRSRGPLPALLSFYSSSPSLSTRQPKMSRARGGEVMAVRRCGAAGASNRRPPFSFFFCELGLGFRLCPDLI
jgi:hypothetical protein